MRRLADWATAQGAPAVWRKPSLRQLKRKDSSGGSTKQQSSDHDSSVKGATIGHNSEKQGVVVGHIPKDVLRQIFRFLPQGSLRACFDVCNTFRYSIEGDSFLTVEVKTQHLKDQCFDEVFNIGDIDYYGHDVDFCFQLPPETVLLTDSGWKKVHDGPPPEKESLPLHRRKLRGKAGKKISRSNSSSHLPMIPTHSRMATAAVASSSSSSSTSGHCGSKKNTKYKGG